MSTSATQTDRAAGEWYPIRTVSDLTGVNAVTLRAWERRYGLIRPVRSPGGALARSRALEQGGRA